MKTFSNPYVKKLKQHTRNSTVPCLEYTDMVSKSEKALNINNEFSRNDAMASPEVSFSLNSLPPYDD